MRHLWILFVAIAVGGCNSTILEMINLDNGGYPGPSITTDAKQRLITNTTYGVASGPGRIHPRRIICVEPSPDVAVTVANQLSAGVSAFGYGSGSLSSSTAEGIAQLAERTTAIQALLKQGYQSCLDYANGAITGTTYSQRTSRLDDLMVTLILAENASGAFGRSGAHIGGKASGSAEASLTQLDKVADDVETLQKKLTTTEAEIAQKEKEVAAAQATFDAAPADKNSSEKAVLDAKKAELAKAEAERRAVLAQLTSSSQALANSAAEISKVSGVGGLTASPDAEIAKILGEMQARFMDKDIDQAYIATCLTELGHRKIATEQDKAFRQLAYNQLKNTYPTDNSPLIFNLARDGQPPNISLSDYDSHLETFFLGSQLADENQLTRHCRENLRTFVETSIRNRQDLKLKQLAIEESRLALLTKQAEVSVSKVFHPKLAMARLLEDIQALTKVRGDYDLIIVKVPNAPAAPAVDPNAGLRNEAKSLIAEVMALEKVAAAATVKAMVDAADKMETTYVQLVADVRQEGTTLERKAWRADYDKQQAEAESKSTELTALSGKVRDATAKLDDLRKRLVQTFKLS